MSEVAPVRWSHVGLNCRDIAATEEFYRRRFGFRRARVIETGDGRVIFLRAGDVYLELFEAPGVAAHDAVADGPGQPGLIRHLAFQVTDLDGWLAGAGDQLVITLGPLRFDEVIPGWRTVWVRDPDGVIVEVSQGYTDQDPASLAGASESPAP
ncbi:VOC family protein [Actinoplanes oblitus]|uniref:VOC family protein n=1 Tax=Actinoplanes oblitus TaxID=3040509 RepID=A0ABY8W4S1_9ACTN|nr:VOC family protein [Actinoplanes oblitus]WIM92815.1 VOC family protein [Actinoplanes oblitus]